jgi:hypothetical protein
MRRTLLAALLGTIIGFGSITTAATALADVTIESSNNSEDSEATSGQATSGNSGSGHAGPVNGGGGAILQDGDNEMDADQEAGSKSGDTVAGGQATGVAASGDQDVTIRNTNNSENDQATSGDASAGNLFGGTVGPINGGPGLIFQVGDNELDLGQTAESETGDAVAGGQVTGVVVF